MPTFSHVVNIIPPTTREDGTPLLPEEIREFQISRGNVSGSYNSFAATVPGDQRTAEIPLDDRNEWYLAAKAVDQDGRVSQFGGEVFIPKGPEPPSAPDLTLVS